MTITGGICPRGVDTSGGPWYPGGAGSAARGMTSTKPNISDPLETWPSTRQPGHRPKGPGPPAALPAGGLVFFPDFGRAPQLGVRSAGGVLHSGVVATVAPVHCDGRTNGEGWPPHAVKGPGDDDAPPLPAGGAEPPTAGKAAARPVGAPGKDVGGVRPIAPNGDMGGPYNSRRGWGAPLPMMGVDLPTGPAPSGGQR